MPKETFDLRVCSARVELTIPGALTLKDRRQVVRSLVEKLKNKFNLSVCDLDGGARGAAAAALGLACAANSLSFARETVEKAVEFIAQDGRAELGVVETEEL